MNKFYRVLSVVTLTLSVALWSCKGDQGPVGPAGATGAQGAAGTNGTNGKDGTNGTNGTNGKDGNANVKGSEVTVKASDWKTIDAPGLGTGSTGKTGTFVVTDANIKATTFVFAYVKVGTQFIALPRVVIKETDGSTEQVNFGIETGKLNLYYVSQTAAIGGSKSYAPQTDLVFSYVVIEKSNLVNLQAEGVNLRSRDAVLTYLQEHKY
ncbi:hypothetical protein [Emticicia sp. SJ17W-69]|uniref:hypothetical protein n=1 Tax=Emticicia sp. SJ17W-69 TaxID=3421657 RepID=UPI003EBE99D6